MKDLYTENYKILGEIFYNLNKWGHTACSQIGKFHTVTIASLCINLQFSAIPWKPKHHLLCVETDKIILKLIQKFNGSRIGKIILRIK